MVSRHLHILSRAIAVAVLLAPLVIGQTSPTVDLGYANYQGTVNTANNITNFLGIRYAAAPLGNPSLLPSLELILMKTQGIYVLEPRNLRPTCRVCN
jgi:hypothetical protein